MQRNGTMAPCGFFTIGDETSSISVPSSVSNTGSCPLEVLIFAEARVPDKQGRHLSNRPASQLARQPGQRMSDWLLLPAPTLVRRPDIAYGLTCLVQATDMKGLAPAGADDLQFDQLLGAGRPHTCERRDGSHAGTQVCAFVCLCAPRQTVEPSRPYCSTQLGARSTLRAVSPPVGVCGSLNQYGCSTAYSLPRKEGNQRSGSMACLPAGGKGVVQTHVNNAVASCALYIIITNELLCIYAPRPSSRVCSSSVGLVFHFCPSR